MKNFIKKNRQLFLLILLSIAFFSATLTITWDGAHYLSYVDIFEENKAFYTWDIVRGPVFPIFIYLGDKIFGKSAIGILSLFFIVYLLYCFIIEKISNEIFDDIKFKKIFKFLFFTFAIFNPVVFGYFHTLLTEILAIFLMVLSCYFAYKWVDAGGKKQKIFYSLFFMFLIPFSYFLKQPYICIAFFPLVFSSLFSFLRNFSKMDLLYRFGTLVAGFILLISFSSFWNNFLYNHGADMNSGRDSSSMLTGQLFASISKVRTVKINNYKKISSDKLLSKKEKLDAKHYLKKKKSVMLIKIYYNKKDLEHDIVYLDNKDKSSVVSNMVEISKIFVKHPATLIDSYGSNYCALSSLCVIDTNDGVGYWVSDKIDFDNLFENSTIGYRTFSNLENIFYLSDEKYDSAKYYYQQTSYSITSKLIYSLANITNKLYKLSIILLPVILIIGFIIRILNRKYIRYYSLYRFGMIFGLSSFFTLLSCSFVGQIIDRYSVYCFITSLICFISILIFIIKNIKVRSDSV